MTTGIQKKPISDFLQQLINDANEAIEQSQITIKEKLLYVYNQAIEEGYSPKDAHKLMRENIKDVSDRYIRKVLPNEAKRTYTTNEIGTLPNLENLQETKETVVNIPQPAPNIVDVEPEPYKPGSAWTVKQQEERRTPEAPDHSMVQQLNHINIQLKKQLEDFQKLHDIRMAEKEQTLEQFRILNIGMKKDVERLMDENMKLKSEKQKLETELAKYKKMEELRLAVQRRNIKEWRNPGDKP